MVQGHAKIPAWGRPMSTYRIARWAEIFENNRSKELKKLTWVPVPNSHDSHGYATLVSRKNGPALYGAWMVIVQVASRCDPRGTLLRGGKIPHNSASLALMTRFPESLIQECLKACCDAEIGWIICENTNDSDNPAGGCDSTAGSGDNPAGGCLEGKGREWKEGKGTPTSPPTDEEWRTELKNSDAYKDLNVESEFQKMVFWCEQKNRKPSRGRFLNWLNKCDRPMVTNGHPAPKPSIPGWKRLEIVGEKIKSLTGEFSSTHDEGQRTAIREEISSLRAEKADLESKNGAAGK